MKAFTFIPGTGIIRGIVISDPEGAFVLDPYVYMGNTGASESKILCSRDIRPICLFIKWIDGTYKKIAYDVNFYEATLTSAKRQLLIQGGRKDDKDIVLFVPKQYGVALMKDIKGAGFIFQKKVYTNFYTYPDGLKK